MAAQLYEQWFKLADEDKDGAITGGEAVKFFMRSGLAQATLGQIWELSSGGGPKLNHYQFGAAMRLVSLAQASGGVLPVEQARAVVAGLGPNLAPPRMQGLEGTGQPGAPVAATYTAQVTGGTPYQAQHTGGMYIAQPTGGAYAMSGPAPYQAAGYTPQLTGGVGYAPQVTGGVPYQPQFTGSAAPVAPQPVPMAAFPPATVADITRYEAFFAQLDKDGDGSISGADCFPAFTASGLEKPVLRDIWSVVAGNAGSINKEQFLKCQYLMDLAKRGMPVPSSLPPGPFPPIAPAGPQSVAAAPAPVSTPAAPAATTPASAATPAAPAAAALPAAPAAFTPSFAATPAPAAPQWTLQSQFGSAGMAGAVAAAPTGAAPAAAAATLPAKFEMAPDAFTPTPLVSKVPAAPQEALAAMTGDEKARVTAQAKEAEQLEVKLHAAEQDTSRNRLRVEAYSKAMSEVQLFKSRTDVALLQAQDQAARLQSEAEELRRKYEVAYAAAKDRDRQHQALRDHVIKLMHEKEEAEHKLAELDKEIQAADAMTPEDVTKLEAEVRALETSIPVKQATRDKKLTKVDALQHQKDTLKKSLETLQSAVASSDMDIAAAKKEITQLADALEKAKTDGPLAELPSSLSQAAEVYRKLYRMAASQNIPVPADATLQNLDFSFWVDDILAGAVDWSEDDEQTRGYKVVNAVPGMDVPKPTKKPIAPKPASAAPATTPAVAAAPTAAVPSPEATSAPPPLDPAEFSDPVPPADSPAPATAASPASSQSGHAKSPADTKDTKAATAPVDFGFGDDEAFASFGSSAAPSAVPPPDAQASTKASAFASAEGAAAYAATPASPSVTVAPTAAALSSTTFNDGDNPFLADIAFSGSASFASGAAPTANTLSPPASSITFAGSNSAGFDEAAFGDAAFPSVTSTSSATLPPPAAPPVAAPSGSSGFGFDNPFGDDDNPFAAKAAAAATPAPQGVSSATAPAATAATPGGFDDDAWK